MNTFQIKKIALAMTIVGAALGLSFNAPALVADPIHSHGSSHSVSKARSGDVAGKTRSTAKSVTHVRSGSTVKAKARSSNVKVRAKTPAEAKARVRTTAKAKVRAKTPAVKAKARAKTPAVKAKVRARTPAHHVKTVTPVVTPGTLPVK